MPHDKNGVKINPGDVVRIPAERQGRPHEMVGSVQFVVEGAEKCNLTVEGVLKTAYDNCPSLPRVTTVTVTASEVERLA
jgi:hypothetical protein